jgi:hypothetical protein
LCHIADAEALPIDLLMLPWLNDIVAQAPTLRTMPELDETLRSLVALAKRTPPNVLGLLQTVRPGLLQCLASIPHARVHTFCLVAALACLSNGHVELVQECIDVLCVVAATKPSIVQ